VQRGGGEKSKEDSRRGKTAGDCQAAGQRRYFASMKDGTRKKTHGKSVEAVGNQGKPGERTLWVGAYERARGGGIQNNPRLSNSGKTIFGGESKNRGSRVKKGKTSEGTSFALKVWPSRA